MFLLKKKLKTVIKTILKMNLKKIVKCRQNRVPMQTNKGTLKQAVKKLTISKTRTMTCSHLDRN